MNAAEALMITRVVRAACPAQRMDEYTPDVWFDLMSDLGFDECRAAVITLGRRQQFVSPAEIRTEIHRVRTERLNRAVEDVPAADEDPDDVLGYLDKLRAERKRVADAVPPSWPELGS